MTLKTRPFRLKLLSRLGAPLPGAKVRMQLTVFQVDGPDVVKLVWPLTEESANPGYYSGPAWPTTRGDGAAQYLVTADADEQRMQAQLMTVPDGSSTSQVAVSMMVNPTPWPPVYQAAAEVEAARVYAEAAGRSASLVQAAGDAALQTHQARDKAVEAREGAEAARDAAVLAVPVLNSISLGLAAVADGQVFAVKKGGPDGLRRETRFRRDSSSTYTRLGGILAGEEFDVAIGSIFGRLFTTMAVSSGRGSPGPGTGNLSTGATRLEIAPFGRAGLLSKVLVYANTGGSAELKIFDPVTAPTSYNVVASYAVTLSAGLNELVVGADFPPIEVEADWTFGFYAYDALIGNTPGSGVTRSFAGNASGDAVAFSSSSAVGQWRAEVLLESVRDVSESAAQQLQALSAPTFAGPVSMGEYLSATGVYAAQANTRVFLWKLPFAAVVDALNVRVDAAGDLILKVFEREAAGTWALHDQVTLTVAAGNNALSGFRPLSVPKGGAVGLYPGGGVRIEYVAETLGASIFVAGDATGTGITFAASSARLCANVRLRFDVEKLPAHRVLLDERFNDAGRLTATGAWDYSGDGVLSPSGGDNVLYREELSNLDPVSTTVRFRLTDTASVFGVLRKPQELTFGTAGIVDCAAGKLWLYPYGTSVGALGKEATISMTFTVGHEYTMTLAHEGGYNRLTLRNCTTRETATVQAEQGVEETGRCWGYSGVIIRTGTVRALRMQYALNADRAGCTLFVGDSITEGFNLDASWASRRSSLYSVDTGAATVNAGRGGSNTIDFLRRIGMDLISLRPANVVILMGTNERTSASIEPWKFRMQAIVDLAKGIGAQVSVGTLPPTGTPGDAAFINAANAYIRAFGFGADVTVVDYAKALSVGNDGATINAALFLSDQVHPNTAGHAAMAAQDECDAPMLRY